jgi:hypothetical protein
MNKWWQCLACLYAKGLPASKGGDCRLTLLLYEKHSIISLLNWRTFTKSARMRAVTKVSQISNLSEQLLCILTQQKAPTLSSGCRDKWSKFNRE